jgi:hypothetical protein
MQSKKRACRGNGRDLRLTDLYGADLQYMRLSRTFRAKLPLCFEL